MTKKLILFNVLILLLLGYGCSNDLDENHTTATLLDFEVLDFKEFFEVEASQDVEFSLIGMHPGLIAPLWKESVLVKGEEKSSLTVPLFTEATFTASLRDKSNKDASYCTALLQKLVIVKDERQSVYSCYIVTIFPSKETATKNTAKIDKMFYAGDPSSKFSGVVMYSTLTTNYTVMVQEYYKGNLINEVSFFEPKYGSEYEELCAMEDLIAPVKITRKIKALTKNGTEYTGQGSFGWEVVCVGQKSSTTPPPAPSYSAPSYTIPNTTTTDYSSQYQYNYNAPYYTPIVKPSNTGSSGSTATAAIRVDFLDGTSQTQRMAVNSIVNVIAAKLENVKVNGKQINLAKYTIVFDPQGNGTVNANALKPTTLRVYPSWLSIAQDAISAGFDDGVAIIYHEIVHIEEDSSIDITSPTFLLDQTAIVVPSEFRDIAQERGHILGTEASNYPSINEDPWSFYPTSVGCETYYYNEINAYENEIRIFTNVSPKYDKERRYTLWKDREMLKLCPKK